MKINKKGFTIAEIITTLAVASLLVAFAAGLVVSIVDVTKRQQNFVACQVEYEDACVFVDDFLNNYNTSNYLIKSVLSQDGISTIKITDNNNEYSLTYNKVDNKISAQFYNYLTNEVELKEQKLTKIIDIIVTNQDNIIKCEFKFEDISPLTKLYTFGVI